MLLGPVFSADLVTLARRSRYIWLRVLYVGILAGVLWINYVSYLAMSRLSLTDRMANLAASFFSGFAWVQLFAVLVLTPALVAGTIAMERERRTLEYLLATDLTNLEILGGKLASRLLQVFMLILAGVPVLAIAMLLGGIPPESILTTSILAVSTTLMAASLSLSVSVWSHRSRDAVLRAFLLLVAFLAIPPGIYGLGEAWPNWYPGFIAWPTWQCVAANPLYVLGYTMSWAGMSKPDDAWWTLLAMVRNQTILTALTLGLSLWTLRRVNARYGVRTPRARRRFSLFQIRLGRYPMLWKEMAVEASAWRLGVAGRLAMIALSLLVIIPTIVNVYEGLTNASLISQSRWRMMPQVMMSVMASTVCLILIAVRSAGCITGEKERDCWTSLVSTPLTASEIVLGKLAGTLWSSRWIGLVLCFVWAGILLLDPGFLVALPFVAGTYALLALFAALLGMFFSCHMRNTLRAMGLTLLVGVIVGGGYLFCCAFVFFASGPGRGAEIILAPCIPFLLAFPGMIYVEGLPRQEVGIFVAYVLGIIGYSIASTALLAYLLNRFDELAGRVLGRPLSPFAPRAYGQPYQPQAPPDAAQAGPNQE